MLLHSYFAIRQVPQCGGVLASKCIIAIVRRCLPRPPVIAILMNILPILIDMLSQEVYCLSVEHVFSNPGQNSLVVFTYSILSS